MRGVAGDVGDGFERVTGRRPAGRPGLRQQPLAADRLAAADRQQVGERVEGRQGGGRAAVGELAQDLAEAAGVGDQVCAHRGGVLQARVRAGDAIAGADELGHGEAHRDGRPLGDLHLGPTWHHALAERQPEPVALAADRESSFGGATRPRRKEVLDGFDFGA
jgi:hypothetical protein